MPTPAERKALIFLSLVATLGASVRVVGAPAGPDATESAARRALREQMNAVEAARRNAKRSAPRQASRANNRSSSSAAPSTVTPADARLAPRSGPIDLDRASAEELESLPGIGPTLAARIIADRTTHGPFGSLIELQRVKGIGPALSKRLTPHVTFSGTPRPTSADLDGRSRATGARVSAGSAEGATRRVGRMSIPP